MVRIILILQLIVTGLVLTSCGNTGDLYLPDEKMPKKEKSTSVNLVLETPTCVETRVQSLQMFI